MELWDAYTREGKPTGQVLTRGEPIPDGLYHMVCEVLVRHRDGSYLCMERAHTKPNFPGYYEATAGGSALCGEDPLDCVRRELLEETGIADGTFTEIGCVVSHNTIYQQYLCVTAGDKAAVTLQEGETIAYRWVTEAEFAAFANSDGMIDTQRVRYQPFLRRLGYVR
jgi:8-oxo-dGTP pyrophosphatase MutT (NUDIX family)